MDVEAPLPEELLEALAFLAEIDDCSEGEKRAAPKPPPPLPGFISALRVASVNPVSYCP